MRSRLQKMNPDTSRPDEVRKMTDTELIHSWIENGESLLLRGPSGIGKTQRIRALYPDVIELKLTNSMFPEKVVGSTNIQTGEEIPPNYAKQIILESATDEEKADIEDNIQNIYAIADEIYERSKVSDKKTVVLLDELLNVKPHIQSLVYTLVLNRFVEIGRGVKLPRNVVVVATGNPKKYSSAANDLAKPLEKRFDHILDMEPKVGEWLIEFAIPQKLHPTVIAFILSNYETNNCSEKISDMGYFYEEDEDDSKEQNNERTNDPRGWETISRIVKNFEDNLRSGKYRGMNVENIFMRTVGTKLSSTWTEHFFGFYNISTLSPEEVAKGLDSDGGYSKDDLPKTPEEKEIYTYELLTADETQVEVCRDFIKKYCSKDNLKLFDKYWAGNDTRRLEMLSKMQSQVKRFGIEDISQFVQDGKRGFSSLGRSYKGNLEDRGERDNGRE